ncbi:sigma-70 family RNA polymerase sigma factor [uncultured Rubinisphaera sp.]|uniref:RNA polymerase sigma factor n=1 Tax=uncultured Rubinisphaera sp. TaxID=1678686 RepID=UPI0030DC5D01
MQQTPASLLLRIRHSPSETDWNRLVDLSSPLLFVWSKRLGMSDNDAADHVQEVMLLLLEKLPGFQYDQTKSFRAWLKTVSKNKFLERKRKRTDKSAGTLSHFELTADEETQFWEREYRSLMMENALQLMKTHFEEKTWKACLEHTINGKKAAQIATELGMSESSVYVAKSRVLHRLRQEFGDLLD